LDELGYLKGSLEMEKEWGQERGGGGEKEKDEAKTKVSDQAQSLIFIGKATSFV
jgi:hypothetical protein